MRITLIVWAYLIVKMKSCPSTVWPQGKKLYLVTFVTEILEDMQKLLNLYTEINATKSDMHFEKLGLFLYKCTLGE